ncbi:MAG TPA: pyridoxamine 5'-phosphate oxidase family protein [Dehalococcoidia bacterium]|nr:pyridoxamine 5'-phosphate oxidase family protein [Dehalococcoidia bacterium]
MATWAEFAAAAPELAERGARRLGIGYAFIATIAGDGSPRLHPVTPLIGGGRLLAFTGVHTVKYRNLRRDPRYALHAVLGESDEEFLVTGRAIASDDWASRMQAAAEARRIGMTSRDDVLFELHIERAHWAVWEGLGTPDISRRAKSWREE